VIGDGSDADVLRGASAAEAQAVGVTRADDFENAFIVLAVKALTDPRRCSSRLTSAKISRALIKLARPDVIVAPAALDGELLATASLESS